MKRLPELLAEAPKQSDERQDLKKRNKIWSVIISLEGRFFKLLLLILILIKKHWLVIIQLTIQGIVLRNGWPCKMCLYMYVAYGRGFGQDKNRLSLFKARGC